LTFGFFGFFTGSASAFVTLLVVAQAARVSWRTGPGASRPILVVEVESNHQKLPVAGLRDKPLGPLRPLGRPTGKAGPAIGGHSVPNRPWRPVCPIGP
jgi:hypothetical protein